MSAALAVTAHTARAGRGTNSGAFPLMTCLGLIGGLSVGLWIGIARVLVLIGAQF